MVKTKQCDICGAEVTYDPPRLSYAKAMADHKSAKHPEVLRALMAKAREKRWEAKKKEGTNNKSDNQEHVTEEVVTQQLTSPKNETRGATKDTSTTTTSLERATTLVVKPQKMEINSMLFQIAKKICEIEWGWPELSPEDWLDTYLFETMRQRGYLIGAYMKIGGDGDEPGS